MSPLLIFSAPYFLLAAALLVFPKAVALVGGWRERIDDGYAGHWGPPGYVAHPLGVRLLGLFMLAAGALLIYISIAGS
jgi:hypothetical protein